SKNEKKAIVQTQRELNRRVIPKENRNNYQANRIKHLYSSTLNSPFETMDIGSVLI
ncbi:peptidase, partial [Staphylococcus aureus]